MADDAQDKTLPATPRKIQNARRDGQVARSRDLGHFAALGLGVAVIGLAAPFWSQWMLRLLASGLRFDLAGIAEPVQMLEHAGRLALQMLALVLPLGVLMALLALASGLLSGGWNFSLKAMKPSLKKLDPLAGLKRLLSPQSLVVTLKSCLLALLLGSIGALYLALRWDHYATLAQQPFVTGIASGGQLLLGGLLTLSAVLALFALIDVPLQRHLLLKRLRMSLQEVKKEMKDTEGSPELKARLKQRMRELSSRRMLAQVPLADLVVMNPTHYAVALKYEPEKMGAPRVVAKGADLLAMRIRDIAEEAKVPVLQAPPLARALYTHCEVDHEVPQRLFGVVAQVLAWVYQLRDAIAAGKAVDLSPPQLDVPPDLDPANKPIDMAPDAAVPARPRAAAGQGTDR
jgi:flagellar biosynthesis protein FlhB